MKTKFNRKELRLMIRLLKSAQKRIDPIHDQEFVCPAINGVVDPLRYDLIILGYYLTDIWIPKLLRNCYTLDQYLSFYHPEFVRTDETMKTIRIKWIDWMIKQLSNEFNSIQ